MSAPASLRCVFLGLAMTSSWGNGHATTYRSLIRALAARGHHSLFLERNLPWYADNRDLPEPGFAAVGLYDEVAELDRYSKEIENADLVVVGSYTPDGIDVGRFVLERAGGLTAFYDIDTPVTLSALQDDRCTYITRQQVAQYDMYLSFTGGPTLRLLEREFGSPMARALYCSVDTDLYAPMETAVRWDLGYLGTYSDDRQPGLEIRLLEPARRWSAGRFVVAGAQFPTSLRWPPNVDRIVHLSPPEHARFYAAQRFTLNLTRSAMVRAGYSPSVRLFEAAACGTPIISDWWEGLADVFLPGEEILMAASASETLAYLHEMSTETARQVGARARARVLGAHTSAHRALELESYVAELRQRCVA
jgi:spore maturation protein CgeB